MSTRIWLAPPKLGSWGGGRRIKSFVSARKDHFRTLDNCFLLPPPAPSRILFGGGFYDTVPAVHNIFPLQRSIEHLTGYCTYCMMLYFQSIFLLTSPRNTASFLVVLTKDFSFKILDTRKIIQYNFQYSIPQLPY